MLRLANINIAGIINIHIKNIMLSLPLLFPLDPLYRLWIYSGSWFRRSRSAYSKAG